MNETSRADVEYATTEDDAPGSAVLTDVVAEPAAQDGVDEPKGGHRLGFGLDRFSGLYVLALIVIVFGLGCRRRS